MTFDLKNDGPTLTGAAATFNINLNFPPNQTALSDGQVVWAQNCTVNGRRTCTEGANFGTETSKWAKWKIKSILNSRTTVSGRTGCVSRPGP